MEALGRYASDLARVAIRYTRGSVVAVFLGIRAIEPLPAFVREEEDGIDVSLDRACRMSVTGAHHAGVTVTSIEASLRFYRDVLGLQVLHRRRVMEHYVLELTGMDGTAVELAFLAVPGSGVQVELVEYEGVDRRPAASRPSDPANAHFCLLVEDVDEIHRRILAAGFEARSQCPVRIPVGPNAGGKVLYAVDPDGAFVELLELPLR